MAKNRNPRPSPRVVALARDFVQRSASMKKLADSLPAPPFGCPGREQPPSAAHLPSCQETCSTCASQYLPEMCVRHKYTRLELMDYHDDVTAAVQLEQFTADIDKSLAFLRSCIDEHGDTIMRRWHNRTAAKREALLIKAMPDMYKHEMLMPELHFQSVRRLDTWLSGRSSSPALKTTWELEQKRSKLELLPYLRVDALSQDRNKLLALLHHRTKYDPSEWVMFDFEQVRHPFNMACALPIATNPHCVVMQGDGYGRLVPWTAEAAHRFDVVGYPRARLILQAQAILLNFLSRSVELILDNQTSNAQMGREKWDTLLETQSRTDTSYLVPSGLSNSAFAPPPTFDLDALLEILSDQARAVTDELEQLQTDPIYIRFCVQHIRDTLHFAQRPNEEAQIQELFEVFMQKFIDAVLWRTLVAEVEAVVTMRKVHGEGVEYNEALRGLHRSFVMHLSSLTQAVQHVLCRSKAFSYVYKFDQDGQEQINAREEDIFRSDVLCWHLVELCIRGPLGPAWHLAGIDKILANASAKERARVDPSLAAKLTYISAISRGVTMFQQHRPHHGPMISAEEFKEQVRSTRLSRQSQLFQSLAAVIFERGMQVEHLKQPLQKFMSLPLPAKRVNEQTWHRLEALRTALADFWDFLAVILTLWVEENESAIPEASGVLQFRELIAAHLTESHERQLEDERTSIEEYIRSRKADEAAAAAAAAAEAELSNTTEKLAITQTVWGVETQKAAIPPKPKAKVKTRQMVDSGTAAATGGTEPSMNESEAERKAGPTIAITKASLAVFEQMFNTYSAAEGDLQWTQLVSALVDAGCSATPCGGSAVSFRDEVRGKGTVVLHRPHPIPSVDPVMLRSTGRRLARWFGWGVGTFVKRVA
ncbi:hypothetical protein EJ03DRAFT_58377 [Teratosphaeria nubilosa]|uniref:Uncharacterized protein n=1 Tax=Teratosphaeria nubilosa TaxID=161662 RepID=A0A6G1KSR6_9PEZI|nr:hypothetical protein EJ03DRAFT_58377 [Teratosphaeria nubilosa]